jgi:hypothetical protein
MAIIIIMAGTMVEAITMAGGVADITDGGRARVHFLRKKHPDEEREEPAKDEARKMIIEEYANSLRELILHQKGKREIRPVAPATASLRRDRYSRARPSERMLGYRGPAQPSPTLGDALNAGYLYLEVRCLGCDTHQTVALDIVRRPRATPVHELERYMRCKDCSQVRGYPYKRSHLVALRTTKISASDPPSTLRGGAPGRGCRSPPL